MAIPTRAAQSVFGPQGGSTTWWTAGGRDFRVPATGTTGATNNYVAYVAPSVSTNTTYGVVQALEGAGYIQTLGNIWITSNATISANLSGLSINFSLYRAGAQLGSATFAGWGATGNTPAITAYTPLLVPFIATNTTALVAPPNNPLSSTAALAPLNPTDVIVATIVTPNSFTTDLAISFDIN